MPYIKVKIGVSKKAQGFEGIIGVANTPENGNKLIVSVNEPGKYKQATAEKFFKSVKIK